MLICFSCLTHCVVIFFLNDKSIFQAIIIRSQNFTTDVYLSTQASEVPSAPQTSESEETISQTTKAESEPVSNDNDADADDTNNSTNENDTTNDKPL